MQDGGRCEQAAQPPGSQVRESPPALPSLCAGLRSLSAAGAETHRAEPMARITLRWETRIPPSIRRGQDTTGERGGTNQEVIREKGRYAS